MIVSDLVNLIGAAAGAFGSKPKVPELTPISATAEQQATAQGNLQVLPEATKLASQVDQFKSDEIAKMLGAVLPGYQAMLAKGASNAAALMSGQLPSDVTRSVTDAANARAVAGGFGGESGLAHNLTLRDLGLTSLEAENMGLSQFTSLLSSAKSVTPMPFDFTTAFLTPGQRMAFDAQQQEAAFRRNWLDAQVASAPDPSTLAMLKYGGAVGDDIATLVAGGMGAGGMAGAAGGMMGGGGGGGGGSSGYSGLDWLGAMKDTTV